MRTSPEFRLRSGMLAAVVAVSALLPLAAPAGLLFPAGALAAPSIGGFSVRPATSDPANPATRAYFVQTLARGGYVRDELAVSNVSSRPVRLRVYPVDGVTGATSGAVYTNLGNPLRKAGRWLRTDVSTITLAPHQEALVPFVVGVPRVAVAGDHLAGVAVENTSHRASGGRFSVTEIVRAVVGVEIEVPGPAVPQVVLRGASLKALPGTQVPSVVVNLGDAGLKLCKPTLAVTLSGSGARALTVRHTLDTILPRDYIPYPLPWPKPLANGTYTAAAVATGCGHTARMTSSIALGTSLAGTTKSPGFGTAAAQPTHGTPWWLLALIALAGVAGGVGAACAYGRRRSLGLPSSG